MVYVQSTCPQPGLSLRIHVGPLTYLQDVNWELFLTVASTVIAAVAAVAACWQAKEARKARTQANTSAAEATEAQQRIAKAIEQLNPPSSAAWKIAPLRGGQYALTNVGGLSAVDVRVYTDSAYQAISRFPQIKERSEEVIWYVGRYDSDHQIRVTWNHADDTIDAAPREWTGVIPSRTP